MNSTTRGLSPMLVALMSVATGLAVACNYYAQPLLETIARSFDLSVNQAGFIVTTAQLGYAAGLLLLVPLGDRPERRGLIVGMSLLAAGGMVITALSTQLSMMLLGTALTGLFSVVAQLLVPLAATRRPGKTRQSGGHGHERPAARYFAGAHRGRRAGAAGRLARGVLGGERADGIDGAGAVARPAALSPDGRSSYPQLLGSIFRLYASTRVIRTRAIIGCLSFANFSVLWTSMAFLLAAPPGTIQKAKSACWARGRSRRAGGASGGLAGGQRQGAPDHDDRPAADAGLMGIDRAGRALPAGPDRRDYPARSGGTGRTYHQPERDLPPSA